MKPLSKIILHIGLPKTGTTTFQHCLAQNMEILARLGFIPYQEASHEYIKAKAVHLPHSIIRDGVFSDIDKPATLERFTSRMDWYATHCNGKVMILSSEPLSFVRTRAEVSTLKDLLYSYTDKIEVILVLREKKEWWRSYKANVKKNIKPGTEILWHSQYNINSNSWVLDWPALIEAYEAEFGKINILNYHRSHIIPDLFSAMQIPHEKMNVPLKRYARTGRAMWFHRFCKSFLNSRARFSLGRKS